MSRGSKVFLALLLLLGGVAVAGLSAFNTVTSSAQVTGKPVSVTVPRGAGVSTVARLLAERGVIDSSLVFSVVARFDERAGQIKAGTYRLRPGMGSEDILEVISTGPPPAKTWRVTIPEGLTVPQTLDRVARAGGYSRKQLRAALRDLPVPRWVPRRGLPPDAVRFEGLLFPDTYEFVVDSRPRRVLARLVRQTETVLNRLGDAQGLSRYQLLIMGSLIEREARLDRERPLISAVLHNRLADDQPLQIDATVLYALGGHKNRVLLEDLEVDSPWNTYRVTGLPPTPIAGAGEDALRAAANPADKPYRYYVVVDPDTGRHAFSRTYDEFLADKRRAQSG